MIYRCESAPLSRRARSPIRVRSLAIFFLPLCVVDVCPPTIENCGGLHSTGITRLLRYSGRHPKPSVFCRSSFYSWSAYSAPFSSIAKNLMASLVRSSSLCVARCCLRPRSGRPSLVLAPWPLLPASFHKRIGPPKFTTISGLTTRFSVLRFTSQPLLNSVFLRHALGVEFPALALSIASRVPSYSLARVTHFDEHMGWLTIPFPEGYAPP